MKKTINSLLVMLLLIPSISAPVKADNDRLEENILLTEHSQVIYTEDDFTILVPTEEDPFGSLPTTRGVIWSAVVTIYVVANHVVGTCGIVELVSDWNPCISAKNAIVEHVKRMELINGSHKYRVTREWITGKIPGCEPMYSGVCNTGYYKYTFTRVK